MAIEHRFWSPDTCNCKFGISMDTGLASDQIVAMLDSVISTGPEHAGFVGQALFNVVLAENKMKNVVEREAKNIQTDLLTRDFFWNFDGSRILHVSFVFDRRPGDTSGKLLSNAQKTTLRQRLNTLFGANKVIVG